MDKKLITMGLVLTALLGYQLLAYQYALPFAFAASPQTIKNSVTFFQIERFYSNSCDVRFFSSYGEYLQKNIPDCDFGFNAEQQAIGMKIMSVDRGVLTARLENKMRWDYYRSTGSNWYDYYSGGLLASDYPDDDLDWHLEASIDGVVESRPLTGSGCIQKRDTNCRNPCVTTASNLVTTCSDGNGEHGVPSYAYRTVGTRIKDASNTFQIETTSPSYTDSCYGGCSNLDDLPGPYHVNFKVVKPSFFTQEQLARNTITPPDHRISDCPIKPNMMLVHQFYQQGEQVTLDGFLFDVSHTCDRLPVVKIDTNGDEISSDSTPYEILHDGGTITIPFGEIWEFFYIINRPSDLPIVCEVAKIAPLQDGTCPEGGLPEDDGWCYTIPVFDPDTGECLARAGILYTCLKGIWVPELMSCVGQPDNPCPVGYVLDVGVSDDPNDDTCFHIPVPFPVCYADDEIYDPDLNGCYYQKVEQAKCVSNIVEPPQLYGLNDFRTAAAEYDSDLDVCKAPRPIKYVCDSGQSLANFTLEIFNPETGDTVPTPMEVCYEPVYPDESCLELSQHYTMRLDNTICTNLPDWADECCAKMPNIAPGECLPSWDVAGNHCNQEPYRYWDEGCRDGTYTLISGDRCVHPPVGVFYCDPGYNAYHAGKPITDGPTAPYTFGGVICGRPLPSQGQCEAEYGVYGESWCWKAPKAVESLCPGDSQWNYERKACALPLQMPDACEGGQLSVLGNQEVCLLPPELCNDGRGELIIVDGVQQCVVSLNDKCEGEIVQYQGKTVCLITPDVVKPCEGTIEVVDGREVCVVELPLLERLPWWTSLLGAGGLLGILYLLKRRGII